MKLHLILFISLVLVCSGAFADNTAGFIDGVSYISDGVVTDLPSDGIYITFTLLGDANLAGTINPEDYMPFSHEINLSGVNWDDGEFTYDGTINSDDFTPFVHNSNQSAVLSASADEVESANGISISNVPEPISAGVMAIAGLGFLRGRRRI
jgi:hypothetical protein